MARKKPSPGSPTATQLQDRECFIISPIGGPNTPVRKHADSVLKRIIEPGLIDVGYTARRFDKSAESGRITEKMIRQIRKCPLCIAVLTDLNPNVMYEVGVRHAWDLPIILLAKKGTKLPFDLRDCNTIYYELDRSSEAVKAVRKHIEEIHKELQNANPRRPVCLQTVFAEAMRELSQIHSLGMLFQIKHKILDSVIDRLCDIRTEVHKESPIDGSREPKSMSAVAELNVKAFDLLATKVAVLEGALESVNHNGTAHCAQVLDRMKGLQLEAVDMYKRWREARGTYDNYQMGLRDLDSLIERFRGFKGLTK